MALFFDANRLADQICNEQRYDEEEIPFITKLVIGAKAFLENAGAYRPSNDLTETVISLIVGHWLEHRESNYKDFRMIGDFPIGVQALISQLQYTLEDGEVLDGTI